MSTLATLKTRIADEIDRDDLTSQVETALLDAIDHYADMNLAFNEQRQTVSTTADTIAVTVPTGLRRETGIWIDVSGNDYALEKVSLEFIEELHAATDTTGQPTYYAYLDGTFRLWPTPGQAYTLTVVGVYDESALSADGDTNSFTTDRTAARMVVSWAKRYLAQNVTYDAEMAQAAAIEENAARSDITRKANAKQATGRVRAYL